MNWQDITHNSELVYSSTPEDKIFRTWSLKKTTCNISFYETYPIEDIDRIICGILDSNNGSLEENIIATILGFNVVDDFEVTPKRYADKAELDIFKAIVQSVFDWGLISKKNDCYFLTGLGYRALEIGEKYKFYSGNKILFENFGIKPQGDNESLFFSYYSALGLYSEITGKKQTGHEQIKLVEVFDIEESDLVKRHKLQSKEIYQIYKSETTNYFDIASCDVDIRLFKQNGEYFPIIFYNNQISIEATELFYKSENADLKDKKIEWGLYLKLIKDPDAVLNYETIFQFADLLELDSLVKDSRLVWEDKQLFTFIAENADANQWHTISNQCPIKVVKIHIKKHTEKWDWTSLSLRIDDNFLIENATKFPWNFEIISAKEDISIDVLKILLLIPELKEQEWDWDNIMPQLDFDFIETNIDKIDFELSELTKTSNNDVQRLISEYPDKKWNWLYISTEYELSFILDNILIFSKYLNLKNVINRAFTSEEYVNLFCNSENFKIVLTALKETSLKDYSPNGEEYAWNPELIDFLEITNYLTWTSGVYTIGFECNPFVLWGYDYFKRYHSKIATRKGYSFVSQKIEDPSIIYDYANFNWDWDVISENTNLITNRNFIIKVANKLNFGLLFQHINNEILETLFEKSDILTFLEDNPENWQLATEIASIEFVRRHIGYNWNWATLTKRFCSSIKIESLGNPKWIDKWDWKYLTQNINLSNIYDNLDLYVDYWDWVYLTEKLDKSFILDNLPEYNNYWHWDILLNVRLDKSELLFSTHLIEVALCITELEDDLHSVLWKIITRKFDYTELNNLIFQSNQSEYADFFLLDYTYFYGLPEFNIRNYLQDSSEYIRWTELSHSKKLNQELKWEKSLFSYDVWLKDVLRVLRNKSYKWNFNALSKLDSINWNDSILSINTDKWDWEYLSEFSTCFKKEKDFDKRFQKFSEYIVYSVFSKRRDAGVTEKTLSENIDKDWDWDTLSENDAVKISFEFIKEHKDKQWNWEALSFRNDIELRNEILIELSDKEWDWEEISKRTDINFSEEIINQLYNKPLDWEAVSQNKTFEPTLQTLSLLKGKTLNWSAISLNENISKELFWDYREALKWELLTRNKQFDISDVELLSKYQDYIDWKFISKSNKFNISIDNLKRFKDKLHWATINSRTDFLISEELLEPFADVLDWSNVSKSMEIHFSEELIEEYRNYWDWQLLRKNNQIIERLDSSLEKYQSEFNCVDFIERFDRPPFIYHFTHLFNAVDIIRSRKILSRHKAEGKFSNAAGNLVARRDTAHNFARFYYRPQTPTQFYNECLGMDSESGYLKTWRYWDGSWIECSKWKSYYPQARNLGLPKCPVPVFFKFDLREVIRKMPFKCYYSTGNMQTNWARVEKISENPNAINTRYLYSDVNDYENYKQYSQQEFLVEEEFDFSSLDSFEIICYDEEHANILKSQLGNDPICEKIHANSLDIFHRDNRKLNIKESETEVSIYSEYRDNAYLSIKGIGLQSIQILNPNNIQKETATEIIAYPEIRFTKTEQPLEIYFVDTAIGTRDWLVYKI